MATTPNRNYPLPDEANTVKDEFLVLQQETLLMLDGDIQALLEALSGKASEVHTHTLGSIEGLQEALDDLMPADREFSLADLTDVVGSEEAPDGYILVKVGSSFVAQAAASALGNHQHQIEDVLNLETALNAKLNSSRVWTGSQAQFDALETKVSTTLYFIV